MFGKSILGLCALSFAACMPNSGGGSNTGSETGTTTPYYGDVEFARSYRLDNSIPDNGPVVEAIKESIQRVHGSPGKMLEEAISRKSDSSFGRRFWQNFISDVLGDFDDGRFYEIPEEMAKNVTDIKFTSRLDLDENSFNASHEVESISFRVDGRTYFYRVNQYNWDGLSDSARLWYDKDAQRLNIDTHDLPIPLANAIASQMADTTFFLRGGPIVEMLMEILSCDSWWASVGSIEYDGIFRNAFLTSCQLIAEDFALDMRKTLAESDGEYSLLSIRGSAKTVDYGDDKRIDNLDNGLWSGTYIHDFEESDLRNMSFGGRRSGGFY